MPSFGIPPKMYRHFAVVTVLLTACIALFADGERRDAIAEEVAEQQQRAALQQQQTENAHQRQLVAAPPAKAGSGGWGSDAVVDPQGQTPTTAEIMISDSTGQITNAKGADFGVMRLPGLSELQNGTPPQMRTKAYQRAAPVGPSRKMLEMMQRAGDNRAGAPTPPPVG